jgi:protease I
MAGTLQGRKIAFIVTDGFEQVELTSPKQALEAAGAHVDIVSDKAGTVQGMNHDTKADAIAVDRVLDAVDALEYDGLVLPGGVVNADAIRLNKKAQSFVKAIDGAGKPVAVICHGAWLLISSGLVEGRTLTSWPSLHDDIRNAGGKWVDQEVVRDGSWVSSRKPDDLPGFNQAVVALMAEAPERVTA